MSVASVHILLAQVNAAKYEEFRSEIHHKFVAQISKKLVA